MQYNPDLKLVSALEQHDLVPPSVSIVVTTHGHPDHAGGVHDFPDAIHYQGWYIHHHTTFNLSNLFEVSGREQRRYITDYEQRKATLSAVTLRTIIGQQWMLE